MFCGFCECPSDSLGGLHRQVLDRFFDQPVGLFGWQLAAHDLELLIDQVRHDLRHLLPAAAAGQLLLRRVPVAEGDRKPESLQLGQVSEDGPGTDIEDRRQVDRTDPRAGGGHRQDDQEAMQARRLIHVADRSTAFMGPQFNVSIHDGTGKS